MYHVKTLLKYGLSIGLALGLVGTGIFLLWASSLTMPSLESVAQRRVEQSTKIYDRTGEVLLYDLHKDVKRTIVPFNEMSRHIKNATIAIEDDNFYNHYGIEPTAIIRAVLANLLQGDLLGGQGGSTITQQVVKNTLLERDKTISRKFKEWVLSIKLEQQLTKDEILEMYLNEAPYGGTRYGVEEASRAFFNKSANDLSIAESAYLAALPQAPTYYSPYGNHREELETRKNLVLERMLVLNFITQEEFESAGQEEVIFQPTQETGIAAPHFVFYVIDELRKVYSEREIQQGGLQVITTLDYELQEKGEEIVNRYALENTEKFNATNAALVAIDPRSGELLTMIGSRNYFDEEIEGNFNITLAERQPGSVFKPFVYAAALEKGYTSETVVFDVATQFSTACEPSNLTTEGDCYSPVNYDGKFRGPVTFREALAQSMNIPAVKALYLAGLKNSLELAQRMGISTLTDPSRYGLTLVLGGGEVKMLDIVSAYGVFASEGERRDPLAILRIEDKDGNLVREFSSDPSRVIPSSIARSINDILSDNVARTPLYGAQSHLYFPGREVAAKTGTTNDYRDAWIIGYTPEIVVGAWAGNNDNSSMDKKLSGLIIAPLWNEYMQSAFEKIGDTAAFTEADPIDPTLKPVLRGIWQGTTFTIDTLTGKLATENTPSEYRKEIAVGEIHSILHWIQKDDPRGAAPSSPGSDGQYQYWEYGVQLWKVRNQGSLNLEEITIPDEVSDSHSRENAPQVEITRPDRNERFDSDDRVRVSLDIEEGEYDIAKIDYFVNGEYIGTLTDRPYTFSFELEDITAIKDDNLLQVVVYDEVQNKGAAQLPFRVN